MNHYIGDFPPWNPTPCTPYQPLEFFPSIQTGLFTTVGPSYPYKFRKVENGIVLDCNGKEYVFKTIGEMSKFLEKELA